MEGVKRLVFVINVDWYFKLHWLDRALSTINAGYEVHLLCTNSGSGNFDELSKYGIVCHDIEICRTGINPLRELNTLIKIYRKITELKPTLIHSVTVKPNVYSGILAKILDIPIICSVTGLGVVFSHNTLKNSFVKKLIVRTYSFVSKNKSSRFLFENSSDLKCLVSAGAVEKSQTQQVSGAGVDIQEYPYSLEDSLAPVSILFAARLLADKGLGLLVEAVKKLRSEGVGVDLKVAGIFDENAQNFISKEQIREWHKAGDITWLGTRSDIARLIYQSSIVCLPTTYGEGIPRILIEASSCGRSVVTTNVSGCNEFVKDGFNGLLVEPNDLTALVSALKCLILDKNLRAELGKNGRTLVEVQYSKDIVVSQTLAAYSNVIA